MPGMPVEIGPWSGGLKNATASGEFIDDNQAYRLENLEVDVDGSLVNRPSVRRALITGFNAIDLDGAELIGTHLTLSGKRLLVIATTNALCLIEPSTSSVVFTHTMSKPRACVSFHGQLFVVPSAAGQGGLVANPSPATFQWQDASNMPIGQMAVAYKDRLFIGADTDSRVFFSDINAFSTWDPLNNFGVGWENGQPLRSMELVGSDIVLFKADSTYRFGYASDPDKGELKLVDGSVGTISERTTAVHSNGTIYTLHGSSVYEFYQNTYTRVSGDLDMVKRLDAALFHNYGVSIYRDRVFVRYHTKLYVLSTVTQRWSEWVTGREFARVYSLTGDEPSDEVGYMSSEIALAGVKGIYYMTDSRIEGVEGEQPTTSNDWERFSCRVVSRTFDFQTPTYYKTITMGGLSIASSSPVTVSAVVPGSAAIDAPTWKEWYTVYTWGSIFNAGVTWGTRTSSDGDILNSRVITPTSTTFGRKLLKCLGKFRYRQVQFDISMPAYSNTVADFSVRIFNLTVHAMQRQTVVKAVS